MGRNEKGLFAGVLGVIALLWCLVVLVFVDKTGAGFDYWGGFVFGLVAIIVPLLLSLGMSFRVNRASKEIAMSRVTCSVVYLIFGVIFNGFFVLLKIGDHKALILIVNVLALLAYLVISYFWAAYLVRVTNLSEQISSKAFQITELKNEIGVLLAICKNGEVREKLMALKTKVDYSDNLSQAGTQNEEYLFFNQLKEIEDLIRNKQPDELIINKISEAESTWNVRSAKLTTVR